MEGKQRLHFFHWTGFEAALIKQGYDETTVNKTLNDLLDGCYKNVQLGKKGTLYTARLNRKDRLLLAEVTVGDVLGLVPIGVMTDHDYNNCKFFNDKVLRHFLDKIKNDIISDNTSPISIERSKEKNLKEEKHAGSTFYSTPICFYNKPIILSDAQGKILKTTLPVLVTGAAGSGKTCIAVALLEQATKDNKKVLYVTQSPALVSAVKKICAQSPSLADSKHIMISTYDNMLKSTGNFPREAKRANIATFKDWLTARKYKINSIAPSTLYQECCIISGYEEKQYLGKDFGNRNSLLKASQRIEMYEIYEKYLGHLRQSLLVDPGLITVYQSPNKNQQYDLVIVDEIQNFSACAFDFLFALSKEKAVCFLGDGHQESQGRTVSSLKYLLNHYRKYNMKHESLSESFRNTRVVCQLASQIIQVKRQFVGGAIHGNACREVTTASKQPDHLALLETKEDIKIKISKALKNDADFAVIYDANETDAKAVAELTGVHETSIYPFDEIQGLEFKSTVVIEPVGGKALKKLGQSFRQSKQKTPGKTNHNQPKDKQVMDSVGIVKALNNLFVAITRSTEQLFLYQPMGNKGSNVRWVLDNLHVERLRTDKQSAFSSSAASSNSESKKEVHSKKSVEKAWAERARKAAHKNPERAKKILEKRTNFNQQKIAEILGNRLSNSIEAMHSDVRSATKTVNGKSEEKKVKISGDESLGENELSLGIHNDVKKNKNKYKSRETPYDNWMALFIEAKYQPQAIERLLQNIPKSSRYGFLNKDDNHSNALMFVVKYSPKAIQSLLKSVEKHNRLPWLKQFNKGGHTALMVAAQFKPEAIALLLKEIGSQGRLALLKQASRYGGTALTLAVRLNLEAIAPLLKETGPEGRLALLKQSTKKEGYTALMVAVGCQPEAIAPLLKGVDAKSRLALFEQANKQGNTVLMMAVQFKLEVIVPLLKDIGLEGRLALLKQATKKGATALMVAVQFQPKAIVLLLKDIGLEGRLALLKQATEKGTTALMVAVQSQPKAIVPLLKDIGLEGRLALLKQATEKGTTALMLAAEYHPEAIALLLKGVGPKERLALLKQADEYRYTALMVAAQCHPEAIAPLLKEVGLEGRLALLKQADKDDDTALMMAAKYHPGAIALLLKGVGPKERLVLLKQANENGDTALMMAAQFQPEAIAPLLKELGPEERLALLEQASKGITALQLAGKYQPDSIPLLLATLDRDTQAALLNSQGIKLSKKMDIFLNKQATLRGSVASSASRTEAKGSSKVWESAKLKESRNLGTNASTFFRKKAIATAPQFPPKQSSQQGKRVGRPTTDQSMHQAGTVGTMVRPPSASANNEFKGVLTAGGRASSSKLSSGISLFLLGEGSGSEAKQGGKQPVSSAGNSKQTMSQNGIPQIKGLKYQSVHGDDHCFYHAVALYLGSDQATLRCEVADYLDKKENSDLRHYFTGNKTSVDRQIEQIRDGRIWGGDIVKTVLMELHQRPIIIIRPKGEIQPSPGEAFEKQYAGEPIFLYYNGANHYDAFILEDGYGDRGREIIQNLRALESPQFTVGS